MLDAIRLWIERLWTQDLVALTSVLVVAALILLQPISKKLRGLLSRRASPNLFLVAFILLVILTVLALIFGGP